MKRQLVLLGDSIFDNGSYVEAGQADVSVHLRRKLAPLGWELDMRAVDGTVTSDIAGQLAHRCVPMPCTFVMSVGGNDALGHLSIVQDLPSDNTTMASLLTDFHRIREGFRARYAGALDHVAGHGQPLIVCTIYNPQFHEAQLQMLATTALSFFNDVIAEEALRRKLPIIDLREVCSDPEAFANPIEPSETGGDLISDAIIAQLPAGD